ncbi:hypothetical protein JYU34_012677 [Plutella xylostella]|uniref:Mot1 central domain-containing protein n=1 Tax=Plutella xylostella TaxID=51655 RepID=A0ABQ7QC68_PLUXY|nr:hypothetical protein JYU34_012677 [Plutella xylostella]
MLARWLCLAMHPARIAVDTDLLLQPPTKERRVRPALQGDALPPEVRPTAKLYLGGAESQPAAVRERNVTRARCTAADVLGRCPTPPRGASHGQAVPGRRGEPARRRARAQRHARALHRRRRAR